MNDLEIASDGTLSPAEADALERAVLERLEAHREQLLKFELFEVITTTVRFREPLS